MARRLKPAIEILSDIGCKAFDLQHHSESDIRVAMEFMRTANGPLFDWLVVALSAVSPEAREAQASDSVSTLPDGENKEEIPTLRTQADREKPA